MGVARDREKHPQQREQCVQRPGGKRAWQVQELQVLLITLCGPVAASHCSLGHIPLEGSPLMV